MSLRNYNGIEFRLIFEYSPSDVEVSSVDLHTGVLPSVSLKLFAELDSPAAAFIPRRPSLWDTSSDATFAFIRRCISDCDDNHNCRALNATARAPKRVLDLRDHSLGTDIRLIQTSTIHGFPRYAALSYCWGNPKEHRQLKTLSSNLIRHEERVGFSSLPKTISDAVVFCRKLDIPYLWVDALCIIQDDQKDKLSEIEAMGHIYANGYLTIAASNASGSDNGFLQPRENPCFTAPFPLPNGEMAEVQWNEGGRGFLNSSSMVTSRKGKTKSAKTLETWHSRGWTFQEVILSRRTILFSIFQPYWVCQESPQAAGEPSPQEYFAAVGLQNNLSSLEADTTGTLTMSAGSSSSWSYKWPWIAENYSARVLSVLEDKPLAIHSIREQSLLISGDYFVGLWSDFLIVDLLWSTVRRHERSAEEVQRFGPLYERGRITNLPSWSWLSFDGAIRFEILWHALYLGKINHMDDITTHLKVTKTPETDVFGRLAGGCLRVQGLVKRVVVIPTKGSGWEGRSQTSSCYDIKIWDRSAGTYTSEDPIRSVLTGRIGDAVFDDFVKGPPPGLRESVRRRMWDFAEDYQSTPKILDCLLIASIGDRKGKRSLGTKPLDYSLVTHGDQIAYGILMEDIEGSNGSQKRRVGLFRGDEGRCFYFDDAVEFEFDFA
ncbi:heterokaryon incompatibility protein-domain-containing protein [Thelonectria olida]|uniref:Heterokaryon incompatibility protein-domain-containing protein n=1 Tax=Thelonectria olida TaxID=1576542 RepID=A0A9P9AN03_9HYPO|nr:heterokaryon incompatibility protein-domain-containing protein [Thelonectria olida]